MNRYSRILDKNPREIVLIKSRPCRWGRCFFCDYIADNSNDNDQTIVEFNRKILDEIKGDLKQLEVINSGSVFEIPEECLRDIKDIADEREIERIYFESHYSYRHRLEEIREFFPGQEIIFKMGMETFDDGFRNDYLRKGVFYKDLDEVASYFQSICLMVGIKGQTREMIKRDMELLEEYFERGCINIFVENTTELRRDEELIAWFRENYSHLEERENIEILWNNTDFGVGD